MPPAHCASFVTFVRKKTFAQFCNRMPSVRMTYFMGPGRSNDKYAQLTLASKRIFYYCLFLLRIRVLFLPVFPFERSEREAKGPYIQILSKNCIFLSNWKISKYGQNYETLMAAKNLLNSQITFPSSREKPSQNIIFGHLNIFFPFFFAEKERNWE